MWPLLCHLEPPHHPTEPVGLVTVSAQEFLHEPQGKAADTLDTALTSRQTEILKRVCQGLTEKEIAYQLNLSPNTVHVHINNIMNKVQIHNKAGLIKYAIKMGFVQL